MLVEIYKLGRRIYDLKNWREAHRFVVFLGRVVFYWQPIVRLYKWFHSDDELCYILKKNPFLIEQATRAFFYAGATLRDRIKLIKNHIKYLREIMDADWAHRLIVFNACYTIWQSSEKDIDWRAQITMEPGQRKEGLLSVMMSLDDKPLYQIIFWINKNKNNEDSLWIGAMQGPNMDDAKAIIKDITKRSHRYRTKNLILYMVMAVARNLRCKHIYAVSNEGYYAMNHVRSDRKLKTDFGEFWEEVGGWVTDDHRFFEIPLVEKRKAMDEVPTRKRAVYRKRFIFQDDVDAQISENMKKIMKKI